MRGPVAQKGRATGDGRKVSGSNPLRAPHKEIEMAIDPKELAERFEVGEGWAAVLDVGVPELIVAALRAYEPRHCLVPPHVHKWRRWWCDANVIPNIYRRTCDTCAVTQTAPGVVAAERDEP